MRNKEILIDLLALTVMATFLFLHTFQIFRGYSLILSLIGIGFLLVYSIIIVRRIIIERKKLLKRKNENHL